MDKAILHSGWILYWLGQTVSASDQAGQNKNARTSFTRQLPVTGLCKLYKFWVALKLNRKLTRCRTRPPTSKHNVLMEVLLLVMLDSQQVRPSVLFVRWSQFFINLNRIA